MWQKCETLKLLSSFNVSSWKIYNDRHGLNGGGSGSGIGLR